MIDNEERVNEIILLLKELASGELKQEEDLRLLIDRSYLNSKSDVLERLSFNGKYLTGLVKIIRNSSNNLDDDYYDKIKSELKSVKQKIEDDISEIILTESEFVKKIFLEKYFSLTQDSMQNTINLCNDLNYLKIYLNEVKRKGKRPE